MARPLFALFLLLSFSLPVRTVANAHDYFCYSYYWNGNENESGTMKLNIQAKGASADIIEESWDDDNLGGDLDPKYRSRGNITFIRFGSNLIVEEVLLSGGRRLRNGTFGGIARVEGEAEGGFYQYKFICKR